MPPPGCLGGEDPPPASLHSILCPGGERVTAERARPPSPWRPEQLPAPPRRGPCFVVQTVCLPRRRLLRYRDGQGDAPHRGVQPQGHPLSRPPALRRDIDGKLPPAYARSVSRRSITSLFPRTTAPPSGVPEAPRSRYAPSPGRGRSGCPIPPCPARTGGCSSCPSLSLLIVAGKNSVRPRSGP